MQANIKASLAYIQPDSVFCHNIFVYLHEHTLIFYTIKKLIPASISCIKLKKFYFLKFLEGEKYYRCLKYSMP